jgi:hypothetical protein
MSDKINVMKFNLNKILLFVLAIIVFYGCSKEKVKLYEFNGKELNSITNNFLNGDSSAVSLIGFLFNNVEPDLIEVNELLIDSITFNSKTKFYYMILESKNPAFNLYTVIDNEMNVLLKDHSLNGNLAAQIQNIDGRLFHIIEETFNVKDTFKVQRTSFYEMKNETVNLAFRSITAFNFGKTTITSSIISMDSDSIKINFAINSAPGFNFKEDKFLFDSTTSKYISENNYLRNFALEQITRYKSRLEINEITDKFSYEKILYGIKESMVSTEVLKKEYSINLSKDWREFENLTISNFLSKKFSGNKYINEKLGANISIIKIPDNDSAEIYIDQDLTNSENFNNPVRFTNLVESGRTYVSFYEYSCKGKKFLLILEAPKFTYERNSQIYFEIIKTFKLHC